MKKHRHFYPAVILAVGLMMIVAAGVFSPADRKDAIAQSEIETLQESEAVQEKQIFSQAQMQIYTTLWSVLEANELSKAAALMQNYEREIQDMLTDVQQGKRFFYNGEELSEKIEGRGMVLTSPATVFYGNFQNGQPEGKMMALQGIVLEKPRYDYSIGDWRAGKMNGQGALGYLYYEETGEGDGLKTEKTGMLADDRMEGLIRYTCIDNSGNSLTWTIQAEAGRTVLDERWQYKEKENEYFLPADNESSQVYSLKGEDTEQELWVNRIAW